MKDHKNAASGFPKTMSAEEKTNVDIDDDVQTPHMSMVAGEAGRVSLLPTMRFRRKNLPLSDEEHSLISKDELSVYC